VVVAVVVVVVVVAVGGGPIVLAAAAAKPSLPQRRSYTSALEHWQAAAIDQPRPGMSY